MQCKNETIDMIFLGLGSLSMAKFMLDIVCWLCSRRDNRHTELLEKLNHIQAQNDRILAQPQLHEDFGYTEESSSDQETEEPVTTVKESNEITEAYTTENIVDELTSGTPVVEAVETVATVESQSTQAKKLEEKHKRLIAKLTPGTNVYVSYKKTTFIATFTLKPTAPHGYVFKAGTEEFVTPTQFSYKRKHSLNPEMSSDNGWDTVYVITGHNTKGKDIRKTLNDLIG